MQIYSVSGITRYLKELLETDATLQDVWISGEVSNLSRSPAGHTYFTLKDGNSQIRCVMFRSRFLASSGALSLSNGAAVIAHGRVSLYEVQGVYQLYVDLVQPEGLGLLHLQFESLKVRLQNEGLFDEGRKRPLPSLPRRIGVATSPGGAVVYDIINVLARRFPLVEVVISPCLVQGDAAAQDICRALRALAEYADVDVIILARGGGSLEDLWPFNEEAVARAIFASPVPVVTGIGHETDFTIADFVADRRAPTPSVAAELIVPDCRERRLQIAECERRLSHSIRAHLDQRRVAVELHISALGRVSPAGVLEVRRQHVDDLVRAASLSLKHLVDLKAARLAGLVQQLNALSPLKVLERGYSICWHEASGRVVIRAMQVVEGDGLVVQVSDGKFRSRVVET
ncbi:MAG: exodeoxyribonuclease VII large subunit [Chloroflexi bacterium]|nr:exodeoxyribonuclease VII large subunit [Chloroflexota bacterium]